MKLLLLLLLFLGCAGNANALGAAVVELDGNMPCNSID
jgi:hypothetical protein